MSVMERPKAASEFPIKFFARDSGLLRFRIHAVQKSGLPGKINDFNFLWLTNLFLIYSLYKEEDSLPFAFILFSLLQLACKELIQIILLIFIYGIQMSKSNKNILINIVLNQVLLCALIPVFEFSRIFSTNQPFFRNWKKTFWIATKEISSFNHKMNEL